MVVQLSSVDPLTIRELKAAAGCGWEVRLLFKDKMVTY